MHSYSHFYLKLVLLKTTQSISVGGRGQLFQNNIIVDYGTECVNYNGNRIQLNLRVKCFQKNIEILLKLLILSINNKH